MTEYSVINLIRQRILDISSLCASRGLKAAMNKVRNEFKRYHRRVIYMLNRSILYGCDIIYINPNQICRSTGRVGAYEYRRADVGIVLDGNWDKEGTTYHKKRFYESIQRRFDHGIDWECTTLAEYKKSNDKEFDSYTERIEDLCYDMKENGYKSQEELSEKPYSIPLSKDLYWDEIAVDIGRDGEFLWVDGRHRLAIAQYLNIKQIPVVVIARHQKWHDKSSRYNRESR
ncbi:hypothetical protein GRS48_10450 [Halorubrum sp. JWXQ-INN 858]|uniref:hypothetical protein n=1 Tax=Halorubrum sp. JWXQ-INN 858 TaxID=2690782 RepID=UPI00135A6CC5|nr:hypothetical protein [Halorubrum sp. JWXQ-INN 858]MWV65235.1 hypothetical protein [Halorubrum sp. JWXQ-INN 858]